MSRRAVRANGCRFWKVLTNPAKQFHAAHFEMRFCQILNQRAFRLLAWQCACLYFAQPPREQLQCLGFGIRMGVFCTQAAGRVTVANPQFACRMPLRFSQPQAAGAVNSARHDRSLARGVA